MVALFPRHGFIRRKSLLGEQALRFVEDAALVAFQPEEIIATELMGDEARAFLLAVQRVGRDQHAGRRLDSSSKGLSAEISLLFSAIGISSSVRRN